MFKHLSPQALNVLNLFTAFYGKREELGEQEFRVRWCRYLEELWELDGNDPFDARQAVFEIASRSIE